MIQVLRTFFEISAAAPLVLLLLGVAVVVLFIIDDDDLPGPRLCRVSAR